MTKDPDPTQGAGVPGQQQYIITEKQLCRLSEGVMNRTARKILLKEIRSNRPTQPDIAGAISLDEIWRGCTDLRSNDSGDALCAMYGECSFPNCHMSGLAVRKSPAEHEAAIAQAARDEVLDEVTQICQTLYEQHYNLSMQDHIDGYDDSDLKDVKYLHWQRGCGASECVSKLESLRSTARREPAPEESAIRTEGE